MQTVAKHFDLLVIGGGSGGIATARRAAEHGAKVGLVEMARIGGTCVNVGCVPKKVMFATADMATNIREHAQGYGFSLKNGGDLAKEVQFDWPVLKAKRDAYITRLNGIYDRNLAKSEVDRIEGKASFVAEKTIDVNGTRYSGDHVLIATGGSPYIPADMEGADLTINSDGFFDLGEQPKKVACIGAGYIAVEMAGILNALGSDSHLFFRRETFLRSFDPDAVEILTTEMKNDGVKLHANSQKIGVSKTDDGKLTVKTSNGEESGFDKVILAVGRKPLVDLNLGSAGIELDGKGFIKVNELQETTANGVYAVGDVTDAPQLTPVAIAAGRKLAERLFNNKTGLKQNFANVPSVVFSHPPLATCGITEAEARKIHGEDNVKVYRSTFTNMFFSMSDHKQKTFMKLVCAGDEEKVVGIHLVGLAVDEMIQGFGIAVVAGLSKADFDATVAVHPSSAEELVTMR